MAALKLFVSHSSRLDDVEHQYTREDRNWALLDDTCKAIKEKYGDRVDVLVDKDGLVPGKDWNHQLNLWLAECHVAIILFSKRAIEKSDWVAREAAILSWRAELYKDFILIPVTLKGESTPEDLAQDFYRVLKIDKNQCIRNAETAADIVAGMAAHPRLGSPDALAGEHPETPLERLQGAIASLLAERPKPASLKQALQAVGCPQPAIGTPSHECYADLLARQLLTAEPDEPSACFKTFERGTDPLSPPPLREDAEYVFRRIRPLWVQPEAASELLRAQENRQILALAGYYITRPDKELDVKNYTLERYRERAWPESSLFEVVTVARDSELDDVKDEIRRYFVKPDPANAPILDSTMKDDIVNENPKTIVLVISADSDFGGLPSPRQLGEFKQLYDDYKKLVLVLALKPDKEILPETVKLVPLDPTCEVKAFHAEISAKLFLRKKYGFGP